MLGSENWLDVFNASTPNKYDTFFSIFHYYFDICFPKVKTRVQTDRKTWITTDLIREKMR